MVLAFAAIYLLWGGTFLAIRVAVHQIPPLFTAGTRFAIAGVGLFLFMRLRGEANLSLQQWRNLALIGLLMFAITYAVFWAQQFVPSGITSIIEATLPITTIALEMWVFGTLPFQWRAVVGVILGFSGVALLLAQSDAHNFPLGPCLVILLSGVAWSFGTVPSARLALPTSRPLTAGSQMMIGGAILLFLSAVHGDLRPLPHISMSAAFALTYLIVCGSLIAYTAYVWLLARIRHASGEPRLRQSSGGCVAGLFRRG